MIVSAKHVLTAAHCVVDKYPIDFFVAEGEHDVRTGNDTPETRIYRILRFIKHSEYLRETHSRAVSPVCLPLFYPYVDFSRLNVIATGFGPTEFGGPVSNFLQKVDLTVLQNNEEFFRSPNIQSSQMCTNKTEKDACQFDSGSPLYYSGISGSKNFSVGQVSLGNCCVGDAPALNTRIYTFMSWIESYKDPLCRRPIQ